MAVRLRNSRKTDTVTAGRVREFLNGWGPRPAFALLRNSRTTDSLRPGKMGEFLARWRRDYAAFALLIEQYSR